jgi:hypothetical protein
VSHIGVPHVGGSHVNPRPRLANPPAAAARTLKDNVKNMNSHLASRRRHGSARRIGDRLSARIETAIHPIEIAG